MARCTHCGFAHAIPGYCSNCGSDDPLPNRKRLKLALVFLAVAALAALASIPVSLYLQRNAVHRSYPAADPVPSPTPVR